MKRVGVPVRHFDWIAHHAGVAGDRIAVIDLASRRSLTYAHLDDRVARLASHLRAECGVLPGDRVAALAHNCPELFELIFACARIGAIYLPVSWRLTSSEIAYILQNAAARVLAVDDECAVKVETFDRGLTQTLLRFSSRGAPNYEALLAAAEPLTQRAPVEHDDVQMLMYTSGTTGFPKGALITYGMVFWNAINVGIPALVGPDTHLLSVMPMFHTGGLNLFALPVFHAGGQVVLMRGFDTQVMLKALSDPQLAITHTFLVPTAYQAMASDPAFAAADLSRLKIACVGGASTPAAVLEQWDARGIPLANGYGMTETSPAVSLLLPSDAKRKRGSVGRALLHTEIRIVDAQGRDVVAEQPGELHVRGPNVTPGYWRNEQASTDAFIDGWLKTGDIVRRDVEGFLYVLDRAKDMYISGGENVYPAEVEQALAKLENIAEAAVIGWPDERWGESGVAFVVRKTGVELNESAVLAHCAAHLARFKLPRRVVFVESLPRTATGKVHKPTLRQQFRQVGVQC